MTALDIPVREVNPPRMSRAGSIRRLVELGLKAKPKGWFAASVRAGPGTGIASIPPALSRFSRCTGLARRMCMPGKVCAGPLLFSLEKSVPSVFWLEPGKPFDNLIRGNLAQHPAFRTTGSDPMTGKSTIEETWRQQSEAAKSEAEKLPFGKKREALIRKARQLRTASQINQWLSSPELKPPE
jgi:hypothetical protein